MALTRKFEGYTEHWDASGGTSTVVFSGLWGNRKADSVIGYPHPDTTISDMLIAASVTIEPWGDASDTGGPMTAKHTVNYTSLHPTFSDWMEQWEAGGEAVTLSGGFKWSDTGQWVEGSADSPASPVKLFPTATIGVTGSTNKFTTGAKTKVLNCVGKINKSAISLKGHNYAAEHLLFLGLNADQTGSKSSGGSDVHQLSYKIAYRHDNTWNEFWRNNDLASNKSGFMTLLDSSGNKAYSSVSFSDIDPANW